MWNNVQEVKLLGKELLGENWRQRGGLGGEGRQEGGRRQEAAQFSAQLVSVPLPASPPPPPGSPHGPLWASSPASLHEILPSLHSLQHCWPRGTGSDTSPPTHTHMHTVDTTQVRRAAAPGPQRGLYTILGIQGPAGT